METINSESKTQSFIILMRWIIIGLVPILCSISGLWLHSHDLGAVIIFTGVTLVVTIYHVRHRAIRPYQWAIIHFVDLVAITLMIMGRNGIMSECFSLYYMVILQAGLVFGVKEALGCLLFSNVLYVGSVMSVSSSEGDIRKLIVRLIYMWLVGVTGSYLAYLQKKHYYQAITDTVTSTYNRSVLDHSLQHEFKMATSKKANLSILMIDLDNFKTVNDEYGHKAGDEVLEMVAGIIKTNIRDIDFVVRYGGEEFIVILPGISMEKALEIAERIRNAVENTNYKNIKDTCSIKVTVSCGVASYPVHADNVEELMDKADKGLYEAKRNGRNLVYAFGSGRCLD